VQPKKSNKPTLLSLLDKATTKAVASITDGSACYSNAEAAIPS